MGTTGPGLYANDLAMDLRSTISAVARLPFDGDRLADILSETEPLAKNPDHEDHTAFWLVVADQFVKRSIACDSVREKALHIIDSGSDLAMLAKLGMGESDLAKRRRILAELRERLAGPPPPAKPRQVLKKPQPFVFEIGDALVFPTSKGECINSYYSSKEKIPGWSQDGWGATIIVERGRAFDFLAWYYPLTIAHALAEKPTMAHLTEQKLWVLKNPGTCSSVHFKRLELEKIGSFAIDADKLARTFGAMPGTWCAVNDVAITNYLSVGPHLPDELMPPPGAPRNFSRGRPYKTIEGLGAILR